MERAAGESGTRDGDDDDDDLLDKERGGIITSLSVALVKPTVREVAREAL